MTNKSERCQRFIIQETPESVVTWLFWQNDSVHRAAANDEPFSKRAQAWLRVQHVVMSRSVVVSKNHANGWRIHQEHFCKLVYGRSQKFR